MPRALHLLLLAAILLGWGPVDTLPSAQGAAFRGGKQDSRLARRRLGRLIRTQMPLCKAMKFRFMELGSRRARTDAPLGPNRNPHGTIFAGSQYSLAVATGWALFTHHLQRNGIKAKVVQREGAIQYMAPISGAFQCIAHMPDQAQIDGFKRHYDKTGSARLTVKIDIKQKGTHTVASTLNAQFTAIDPKRR